MKKLFTAIIMLIIAFSCKTERQNQLQVGKYHIIQGRVYFVPEGQWAKISNDTSFNGFLVKNSSVRKQK